MPDTYHVLEQLRAFTDFGGLGECIFILVCFMKRVHLLHQSPRLLQSTKQAIVAGHMNGGVSPPGPQPQVKKHMTTTLVLFAYI